MSKVVYILPGFNQKTSSDEYQQIILFFKSIHFTVIPVHISWKYHTMSEYIIEFSSQLSHTSKDEVYLFGFSFGAMIALISAVKLKPKMLLLCSLSPYFKEDLASLKKSWKANMNKRMTDFNLFSFSKIVENINSRTILIVGNKEPKQVLDRVNDAHKKIKQSELYLVLNSKHNLSQTEYLNKVREIIFKCVN